MSGNVFKIGVIGHRELADDGEYHYAQICCHEIFSALKKKYTSIKAVSAIAEGADSVFAQMAISSGIQLDTVIPFKRFGSDFRDEESYARYSLLRMNSEFETNINLEERSGTAYKKSMEWVVFKSNLIVAIWDGIEIGSKGGTWEVIILCKALRKPFLHVDVSEKIMQLYFNEGNGLSRTITIKRNDVAKHLGHVN